MCNKCKGTGSVSGDVDGFIDCPCDVGVERAGFNAWAVVNVPGVDLGDAWRIVQHVKPPTFQHFASREQWAEHLGQVAEAQASGQVEF